MTRQIQSPVVIWSLTCFLYLVLLIYLQSFFVLILSLTCFLYVVLLAYLHSFFVLHSFSVFRIKVVLCIESVLCIYTHPLYVPVLLKMTLCLKLCSSFLFARCRAYFIADTLVGCVYRGSGCCTNMPIEKTSQYTDHNWCSDHYRVLPRMV